MKSLCGLIAGSMLLLGLAGCGGSDLDPGVPKDQGYVPLPAEMQPNMAKDGMKPAKNTGGSAAKNPASR